MSRLQLVVADAHHETATIRRVVLKAGDGGPLPGFAAGAHITLDIPDVGTRKYSLVQPVAELGAGHAPTAYTLGVRLEPNGGGGSRYVHGLEVGTVITAEAPQNNFPLTDGTGPVALIAGGIGVTPLISMAAALYASGRPFQMIYAARSRSELAFLAELTALCGDDLTIHTDDEAGRLFDMRAAFAVMPAGTKAYMCGPKPMLKSGMDAARALGWPRDRLAFELFYSAVGAKAPGATPPV